MHIDISDNAKELGKKAGAIAADVIRSAIAKKGVANIIMATGTSQFEAINQLLKEENIAWQQVVMFHLDEYIGLPASHKASFRKYLQQRFLNKLPGLKATYLIEGETEPASECSRLNDAIASHPIDLAMVGIGENGHLAFNDPPADFDIVTPYHIVQLDWPCRQQQLGEGWFKSIDEVPVSAISMTVKQILQSKTIVCAVPDARKAEAVKNCLQRPVSNLHPASILQTHPSCYIFLDKNSGQLLKK